MTTSRRITRTSLISLVLCGGAGLAETPISESNAASVKEAALLRGHTAPVFSLAYSLDGAWLATASIDRTGRIWDAKSGKETAVLKGHEKQVVAVGFSADGSSVVTGSYDKTVRIWDSKTGREKPGAPPLKDTTAPVRLPNIENMVIAFNGDATALAFGTDTGGLYLWDVKAGKLYERVESAGPGAPSFLKVFGVAFGPGGTTLATSDGKFLRTWEIKPLEGGKAFTPRKSFEGPEDADYGSVTLSPDGKLLAAVENEANAIHLFDVEAGKAPSVLKGHKDMISGLSFSPDGSLLASSSYDGTVRLFAVKSGKEVISLNSSTKSKPACVRFSPDGSRLASGTLEGPAIIWAIPEK